MSYETIFQGGLKILFQIGFSLVMCHLNKLFAISKRSKRCSRGVKIVLIGIFGCSRLELFSHVFNYHFYSMNIGILTSLSFVFHKTKLGQHVIKNSVVVSRLFHQLLHTRQKSHKYCHELK